jgi:nucleoside-triphosphatase
VATAPPPQYGRIISLIWICRWRDVQEEESGCLEASAAPKEVQGEEKGPGSASPSKGTMRRALLLTGKPGTGKTALIKEAIASTKVNGGGFYTEEIRTEGIRQGFRIVTLHGQEAILADVSISSPYQVSKYRVDTDSLNKVGVSALRQALREADLIVIDEIGKMELLSPQFKEAVTQVINSGKRVLGTIMLNPHPFADQIKRHPEVETLLVTRDNRPEVMKRVLNWLAEE